jgi:uncharacterized protein (AIM24 family)
MNAIGRLFGWFGRKAFLYIVLVVAIASGTVVVPWMKQVVAGTTPAQVRASVLNGAIREMEAEREANIRAFTERVGSLQKSSLQGLTKRERQLQSERATLTDAINGSQPAWALALTDREELLANERRKLRLAVIDQELPAIAAARAAVASKGATIAARADLSTQQQIADLAAAACNTGKRRVRAYESRWRWRVRQWLEAEEHRKLVEARNRDCAAARAAITKRDRLKNIAQGKLRTQREMQAAFFEAASASSTIKKAGVELAEDAKNAEIELSGSLPEKLRLWAERLGLASILRAAAVALALIIAVPFIIRLLCFFVLAPMAMRRAAIRVQVPEGSGVPIAPAAPSTTSVAVRLDLEEELLVRQDYLQTTSSSGGKSTRWLLDWRKPLTSIATGLTFLTRIRGAGEVTTVSALRDGLAEVTILTLPAGASCVLQPRALAAVAQPVQRPLRITSHWRLGSLNAWLTLQLRYLVFHGPARLVLKGGRGVRVEPAERGRIFGQDQLVGFSADLAYSVTRAETFWPYFLGREQLLKERVLAGDGVLIVEEAPLAGGSGKTRRGLEGLIDAGMKVVGM